MSLHTAIAFELRAHPAEPVVDGDESWCDCGEEWPCPWRALLEFADLTLVAFNEYGGHMDDCPASFLKDAACRCGYEKARRRFFEVRETLELVLGEAA